MDDIKEIRVYTKEEEKMIAKAYDFAFDCHNGQVRQSGEPYISHPVAVAQILAEMKADSDTICAALLHDVVEDCNVSIEDIEKNFNSEIAKLVDGVTKISKLNFSTKTLEEATNTRKIITSITTDVRIIIIKLADRLHNMRTIQFKSEYKQKENAVETMEIFVPLANYIGAQQIKNELEDICFKCLKPDDYRSTLEKRNSIVENNIKSFEEVKDNVEKRLVNNQIEAKLKCRIRNVYGSFKKMQEHSSIAEVHDIMALKVITQNISDCYLTLMHIHSLYPPYNSKFKDYIALPKTNLYQSLHTTVFGKNDTLVQTHITTKKMEQINNYGLTAYWSMNPTDARIKMQNDLTSKFQFFKSLYEINLQTKDDIEFVNQVKKDLFSSNIYVYVDGKIVELPKGANIIDLAFKLGDEVGCSLGCAYVNDLFVSLDRQLKNNDRVLIKPRLEDVKMPDKWVEEANTTYAKQKIMKYCNLQNK